MMTEKGICPTCGNPYALKANGALRRHNSAFPKCYQIDQLPKRLIRQVIIIPDREDGDGENTNSGEEEDPEADISGLAGV